MAKPQVAALASLVGWALGGTPLGNLTVELVDGSGIPAPFTNCGFLIGADTPLLLNINLLSGSLNRYQVGQHPFAPKRRRCRKRRNCYLYTRISNFAYGCKVHIQSNDTATVIANETIPVTPDDLGSYAISGSIPKSLLKMCSDRRD